LTPPATQLSPGAQLPPVTRRDLLVWMWRTVARDRRHRPPNARPVLSMERLRASLTPALRRPIFVVGAPRSGTTFLGTCLGALPGVAYVFEPVVTMRAVPYVYAQAWTPDAAARFYRAAYRWLLRLRLAGGQRLAVKIPDDSFIVPFLARTFPHAQFVHILRDGRDAALSHSRKPWLQGASLTSGRHGGAGKRYGPFPRFWTEPERREAFRATSDFHRCIWAWRRHVEAALEAADALPAERYHALRYERFVRTPRPVADALLDFLDVTDAAARDRLHARAADAHAASVGAWRTALTRVQRAEAEAEAGHLLRALGYGATFP
jgi:hypothetical protein